MQIITIASTAALVAIAAAAPSPGANVFNLNSTCIESEPKVRVYNRCPYDVYLWSVLTGNGCPSGNGAVVKNGDFYQENFRPAVNEVGTSIKISKTESCDPNDLLQLEYYIETSKPGYNYNYLDVSYVNCAETKSCPTASEGFYLKSGNVDGKFMANSLNNICPILSCGDWAECSKVAYVNWDDVQTKSCDPSADLDFYMCGGEEPGSDDTPVIESSAAASSAPAPTSTEQEVVPEYTSAVSSAAVSSAAASSAAASSAVEEEVVAAAITPAPVVASKPVHIRTKVVYVTEYAYVNAKRHEHGHNHKQFHA
jgi:hypothetical protein